MTGEVTPVSCNVLLSVTAGQALNGRLMRCVQRRVKESVSDCQERKKHPLLYSTASLVAPGVLKERRGKQKEGREVEKQGEK